jgi:hypothetical protein
MRRTIGALAAVLGLAGGMLAVSAAPASAAACSHWGSITIDTSTDGLVWYYTVDISVQTISCSGTVTGTATSWLAGGENACQGVVLNQHGSCKMVRTPAGLGNTFVDVDVVIALAVNGGPTTRTVTCSSGAVWEGGRTCTF